MLTCILLIEIRLKDILLITNGAIASLYNSRSSKTVVMQTDASNLSYNQTQEDFVAVTVADYTLF